MAGDRAQELAGGLVAGAVAAELAGQVERAGQLRVTAEQLRAAVGGLERAVAAVDDAAVVTDQASVDAVRLLTDPAGRAR